MKIAIDCRFWGPKHTGLGRYTQKLVENLLKIDNKNQYFLIFQKENLNNLTIEKFSNKTIISVDVNHYSLKEQLSMPLVLNRIKPDLVHFPHFNVPLLYSGRYIVTIHDLIKHYSKGLATTTRQPLVYLAKYLAYKKVFSNTVKKAEKIIVPSKAVKKQLIDVYPKTKSKIQVIYEGVDLKVSTPRRRPKGLLRGEQQYVVYAGNVYPHKNIRRLILAVKMVNQTVKLELVIVSARSIFLKRLKKTINEFKADRFVTLLGFVEDKGLVLIYSQAKAFISPSLMEGFGLPGLEAMASGCPVVCSHIPVFKEVYNKAALYFNPKDVSDIKDKILKVIKMDEQERVNLVKAGEDQAKKYSWQKTARQTLEIYENCFGL